MHCTCNSAKTATLRTSTMTQPHRPQYLHLRLCPRIVSHFCPCILIVSASIVSTCICMSIVPCLCPVARPSYIYKPFGFHVLESSSHSLFSKSIVQYSTWSPNPYIAPVPTLVLRSRATSPNRLLTPLTPFIYVFPLGRHTLTTCTNPTSGAHCEGKSVDIPSVSSHLISSSRFHLTLVSK